MVSVTPALRNITSASRFPRIIKVDPGCTSVPDSKEFCGIWPRQSRFHDKRLDKSEILFYFFSLFLNQNIRRRYSNEAASVRAKHFCALTTTESRVKIWYQ